MADFDELGERARRLVREDRRALLGVTGPPGAGKTSLTELLVDALAPDPPYGMTPGSWVCRLPMDGFHLADVQLDRLRLRDRMGAPETFDAAGYLALLTRVRADSPEVVYAPAFDRTLEQPTAASVVVLPEARLVVTEGNYLLLPQEPWREVRALLDEVWYVDADDAARVERLVRRHVRYGKTPDAAAAWVHGTDQANARLVAATRHLADLVVDAGAMLR